MSYFSNKINSCADAINRACTAPSPFKSVINEKNFDVHIKARHGVAFLGSLKKVNPKQWKILANSGRNLNVLNDNQKKFILYLFNKFTVSYRALAQSRPPLMKAPKRPPQNICVMADDSPSILKPSGAKGTPEAIVFDFAVLFIKEIAKESLGDVKPFNNFVNILQNEFEKERGPVKSKNTAQNLLDVTDFAVKNWQKVVKTYITAIGFNYNISKLYDAVCKIKSFCEGAVNIILYGSGDRQRYIAKALQHKGYDLVQSVNDNTIDGIIIAKDKKTGQTVSFKEQELVNYGTQNIRAYDFLLGQLNSFAEQWNKIIDEFLKKSSLAAAYKKAEEKLKQKYGSDTDIVTEYFRTATRFAFGLYFPWIKPLSKAQRSKAGLAKGRLFEVIKYKVARENANLGNGCIKISDNLVLVLDFTKKNPTIKEIESALWDSKTVKFRNTKTGKYIKADLYNLPKNIYKHINDAYLEVQKSKTYAQRFVEASIDNVIDAGGIEYVLADSVAGAYKGILFDLPAVGVQCAVNPLLVPLFFLNLTTPEGVKALAEDFIDTIQSKSHTRIGAYFAFNLTMVTGMAIHGLPKLKAMGKKVLLGAKKQGGKLEFSLKSLQSGQEILLTKKEADILIAELIKQGVKPDEIKVLEFDSNGGIINGPRKTFAMAEKGKATPKGKGGKPKSKPPAGKPRGGPGATVSKKSGSRKPARRTVSSRIKDFGKKVKQAVVSAADQFNEGMQATFGPQLAVAGGGKIAQGARPVQMMSEGKPGEISGAGKGKTQKTAAKQETIFKLNKQEEIALKKAGSSEEKLEILNSALVRLYEEKIKPKIEAYCKSAEKTVEARIELRLLLMNFQDLCIRKRDKILNRAEAKERKKDSILLPRETVIDDVILGITPEGSRKKAGKILAGLTKYTPNALKNAGYLILIDDGMNFNLDNAAQKDLKIIVLKESEPAVAYRKVFDMLMADTDVAAEIKHTCDQINLEIKCRIETGKTESLLWKTIDKVKANHGENISFGNLCREVINELILILCDENAGRIFEEEESAYPKGENLYELTNRVCARMHHGYGRLSLRKSLKLERFMLDIEKSLEGKLRDQTIPLASRQELIAARVKGLYRNFDIVNLFRSTCGLDFERSATKTNVIVLQKLYLRLCDKLPEWKTLTSKQRLIESIIFGITPEETKTVIKALLNELPEGAIKELEEQEVLISAEKQKLYNGISYERRFGTINFQGHFNIENLDNYKLNFFEEVSQVIFQRDEIFEKIKPLYDEMCGIIKQCYHGERKCGALLKEIINSEVAYEVNSSALLIHSPHTDAKNPFHPWVYRGIISRLFACSFTEEFRAEFEKSDPYMLGRVMWMRSVLETADTGNFAAKGAEPAALAKPGKLSILPPRETAEGAGATQRGPALPLRGAEIISRQEAEVLINELSRILAEKKREFIMKTIGKIYRERINPLVDRVIKMIESSGGASADAETVELTQTLIKNVKSLKDFSMELIHSAQANGNVHAIGIQKLVDDMVLGVACAGETQRLLTLFNKLPEDIVMHLHDNGTMFISAEKIGNSGRYLGETITDGTNTLIIISKQDPVSFTDSFYHEIFQTLLNSLKHVEAINGELNRVDELLMNKIRSHVRGAGRFSPFLGKILDQTEKAYITERVREKCDKNPEYRQQMMQLYVDEVITFLFQIYCRENSYLKYKFKRQEKELFELMDAIYKKTFKKPLRESEAEEKIFAEAELMEKPLGAVGLKLDSVDFSDLPSLFENISGGYGKAKTFGLYKELLGKNLSEPVFNEEKTAELTVAAVKAGPRLRKSSPKQNRRYVRELGAALRDALFNKFGECCFDQKHIAFFKKIIGLLEKTDPGLAAEFKKGLCGEKSINNIYMLVASREEYYYKNKEKLEPQALASSLREKYGNEIDEFIKTDLKNERHSGHMSYVEIVLPIKPQREYKEYFVSGMLNNMDVVFATPQAVSATFSCKDHVYKYKDSRSRERNFQGSVIVIDPEKTGLSGAFETILDYKKYRKKLREEFEN